MNDSELIAQLLEETRQISANMVTRKDMERIDKDIDNLNKIVWRGNGRKPLTELVAKAASDIEGLWRAYHGLKNNAPTVPAGKPGAITADGAWKFISPILVMIIAYFLLTWIPTVQRHIDEDKAYQNAQATLQVFMHQVQATETAICTPTPHPTRTP